MGAFAIHDRQASAKKNATYTASCRRPNMLNIKINDASTTMQMANGRTLLLFELLNPLTSDAHMVPHIAMAISLLACRKTVHDVDRSVDIIRADCEDRKEDGKRESQGQTNMSQV